MRESIEAMKEIWSKAEAPAVGWADDLRNHTPARHRLPLSV
jgi:hypothetical protein